MGLCGSSLAYTGHRRPGHDLQGRVGRARREQQREGAEEVHHREKWWAGARCVVCVQYFQARAACSWTSGPKDRQTLSASLTRDTIFRRPPLYVFPSHLTRLDQVG